MSHGGVSLLGVHHNRGGILVVSFRPQKKGCHHKKTTPMDLLTKSSKETGNNVLRTWLWLLHYAPSPALAPLAASSACAL